MPSHSGPNIKGEENLVFSYDLGDVKNSYEGPPTQNYVHQNVANCSTTSGWSGTSVHTQYGLSRTFGVKKDGKTTLHVMYSPNDSAGTSYPTFTLKDLNGTNVQTNGGEVFYLTFEWKSEGAQYLVEGGDKYNLSTFYGNGWKTGSHMSAQDLGSVSIGNGWYRRTVKYTAAAVAGQTPLMRFGSGYKRTQGGTYQLWVANIAMTSNHPAGNWLPGQSIRSATQGLLDHTANSTIDLINVSFDSNAQMTFDGTDDTASVASYSAIELVDNVSIEYVYKRLSTDPILDVIANKYHSTGWELFCTTTNKFRLAGRNGDGTYYSTTNGAYTIQNNQYYHLVAIKEGLSWRLYVNGELYADLTANTVGTWSNTGILQIGGEGSGYYPNMQLPILKIYNKVLTAEEIKSNFNAIKGRFNI